MNRSKLIAVGVGIGLVAAGALSFRYDKYTGWTDERIDPYTLKAVCKTTTLVGFFGRYSVKEGPTLPNIECREATNIWLTQPPNEGCSVNVEMLTATCKEAYEYPFF